MVTSTSRSACRPAPAGLAAKVRARARTALLAAAAILLGPGGALAQAVDCAAWRSELSSLERGGGGSAERAEAAVRRQTGELNRMVSYARSIGCDRRQFLFFGEAPPPQCAALQRQITRMQEAVEQLMETAEAGPPRGSEARRRDLVAAINYYCRAATLPGRRDPGGAPGGAIEVFPDERAPDSGVEEMPPDDTAPRRATPLGGRAVCVRTCDGFFFPLSNSPEGREGADGMCQSLCPGTQTRAFFRQGDDLGGAANLEGQRYADLPSAFRYTKSYDAACSSRAPGQTWAQALQEAERKLASVQPPTEAPLTSEKADELSRARLTPAAPPAPTRGGQSARAPASSPAAAPPVQQGARRAGRDGFQEVPRTGEAARPPEQPRIGEVLPGAPPIGAPAPLRIR